MRTSTFPQMTFREIRQPNVVGMIRPLSVRERRENEAQAEHLLCILENELGTSRGSW